MIWKSQKAIFIHTFKVSHFTISRKIFAHLQFDGSNLFQEKLEKGRDYRSGASPLLLKIP